ncbi:MAG: IpaD/SipD/SspD family type III secretion system needle tip protein [Proteus vulgaris]
MSFLFDVSLDLSGLDKLMDYLNNIPVGGNDMLQTEFDLLKKTLDSFEKGINTNLDELSKKYSAANSNYDNFVKIVSSTMNTLLEMAKGFLHF